LPLVPEVDSPGHNNAIAKGMKVVMAPANHAYLDQKYVAGSAGTIPPTLGLSWACGTGCDVDQFYNWDPGSYVAGVTDRNVIGVEGAIWGETVVNLSDVDYMVFPRLVALATLSAPGRPTSAITATINWGDGTSSSGTVTGTAATPTTVNGLYTVGGSHRYIRSGLYLGTVTVTAAGTAPASGVFLVHVRRPD
jgi:hypothetical protein